MSSIERNLLQGNLSDLEPGSRGMVIGRVLAWQIGAEVGDELTVMVPGRDMLAAGGRPLLQTFTVTGIFEVGLQDHDASFALVSHRRRGGPHGRRERDTGRPARPLSTT